MLQDARTENFMLVDMDGYICLFTNLRLDRDTIPEGYHCYDVRDSGCDGNFCEIQSFVFVNHWGTIISKEPIPMNEYHSYWPEQEEVYLPPSLTLETYQNTSIAKLVEPYLSDEERAVLGKAIDSIPDDLFRIRHKSFMERSGEGQERLAAFGNAHANEIGASVAAFLGMSEEEYHAWQGGTLSLSDGSRHGVRQGEHPSFCVRLDSAAARAEDKLDKASDTGVKNRNPEL